MKINMNYFSRTLFGRILTLALIGGFSLTTHTVAQAGDDDDTEVVVSTKSPRMLKKENKIFKKTEHKKKRLLEDAYFSQKQMNFVASLTYALKANDQVKINSHINGLTDFPQMEKLQIVDYFDSLVRIVATKDFDIIRNRAKYAGDDSDQKLRIKEYSKQAVISVVGLAASQFILPGSGLIIYGARRFARDVKIDKWLQNGFYPMKDFVDEASEKFDLDLNEYRDILDAEIFGDL